MARQRTPEGPPPPPAVQKLRIRYAKRGRLRFSSTRDFARALERALRRAGVPMAFSAGFHPHPQISYANAAPTGTASEAEYFELRLTERVDPAAVREALDEALPEGLDVVDVVEAGPGALADRLEASDWHLVVRGADPDDVRAAVAAYLATERAETTRTFKNGPRTFDTREAVLTMRVVGVDEAGCAILRMVVRHTTPSVRPDDILTALRAVTGFAAPVPPLVTRLAQGPLLEADDGVADPLATDREAVGPGR
ncbi:TIGR03936 family radical SAM-associated protein [Nostocoides sp. Soil756]|jgi:radical SAM-linked protein|uniref:TIGR03936 family radical SAM-associated protein n=1 Tax=Nostocoides sp. Soil756 TaxID=1736399 RepID=UPI0006F367CB|nr:TIGR03936 family radical SAM-associated protein [Tetrasphaera sp. Soil756]KRE61611.1 radical SAM protein [Tetrasphaera sp. Soil756]